MAPSTAHQPHETPTHFSLSSSLYLNLLFPLILFLATTSTALTTTTTPQPYSATITPPNTPITTNCNPPHPKKSIYNHPKPPSPPPITYKLEPHHQINQSTPTLSHPNQRGHRNKKPPKSKLVEIHQNP